MSDNISAIPLIFCPSWSIDSPPYNLALLKAALKKRGHKVVCHDLNIELFNHVTDLMEKDSWFGMVKGKCWTDKSFAVGMFDKYKGFIDDFINGALKPDTKVIGFSVNQRNYFFTIELVNRIKRIAPDKIIILGGAHCFRNDRGVEVLRDCDADAICTGEGEDSFSNVLDIIKITGRLGKCAGIAFKDKATGDIIDGGDEALREDLDSLPFADFSDFKLDRYREKMLPVLIGRGCVNQCVFCSEWVRFKRYRHRSAKNVFEEIKYQKEKHPFVEWFYFNDSLINADMDALREFCSLVADSGVKIKWCGQAVVRDEMRLDFLKKMKETGCQWLSYGVESGSDTVLKLMRKKFTAELCSRVIRETREAGMDESFNIIVGFPGEGEAEFNKTAQFVKNNLGFVNMVTLNPLYLSREMNSNSKIWDIEFFGAKGEDEWRARDGTSTPEIRKKRLNILEKIAGSKLSMDFDIEVDYLLKKGDEHLKKEDVKNARQYYLNARKTNKSENFARVIDEKIKLCGEKKTRICWDIHHNCNFRCSYCRFDGKWALAGRTGMHPPADKIYNFWNRIYDRYGEAQIEINGGEPFIYPDFQELVSRISRQHSIKIHTNLSKADVSMTGSWNPERVEIIPIFHPSWISYDDFIARVRPLKDKGFTRSVLYPSYPPQLQLSKAYKEKFDKENITFSIRDFSGINCCNGPEAEDHDIIIQSDGRMICDNGSGKEEMAGVFPEDDLQLPEDTALNDIISNASQIPEYPRTYPPYRVFWSWDMLYSCNYKCAYCNIIRGRINCAPEQAKHKIAEPSIFKDIWDRMFELYYSGVIRLTGGEPSTYPGFLKIVSFLTEKHVVNINTNLSFDIYKFMENISNQNVCISVSFHPEFITIKDLMVKLRTLMKNGYGCSVCCVGYPPFLKDLERYKEILGGDNIPFNMSPFMGNYEGRNFPNDYNEDERTILRRITNDTAGKDKDEVNKKWLEFRMHEEKRKDKMCRMGQTYAIILPNGDVKRCCSPFTKTIGNIFQKNFRIFEEPKPCDIDEKWNCPCFKAMLSGKEGSWMPLWAAKEHSMYKKGN